jgi:hypothetical protein
MCTKCSPFILDAAASTMDAQQQTPNVTPSRSDEDILELIRGHLSQINPMETFKRDFLEFANGVERIIDDEDRSGFIQRNKDPIRVIMFTHTLCNIFLLKLTHIRILLQITISDLGNMKHG